jgi:nitrogen fixation NifU-like protein
VAKELGDLPKNKYHCSNLGAQALGKAIANYAKKNNLTIKGLEKIKEGEDDHDQENEAACAT